MEKIFSYNVDIDKTAYMNWRTRQHQPIHDMMIIADIQLKLNWNKLRLVGDIMSLSSVPEPRNAEFTAFLGSFFAR